MCKGGSGSIPVKGRSVIFREMHRWLDLPKKFERSLKRDQLRSVRVEAAKTGYFGIDGLNYFADAVCSSAIAGLEADRKNALVRAWV